ncbi:hypothetical protein [Amycolatopsis pithecellobii]|uniref:Uncharacterized protein n=1 Tax=Amycolatopsis pithecellobii TaxID=664692 RepID=A0A6N7ZAG6_9PSEU|nr:hypothetical protein [Amycolatopsis pithecellobii]MTD58726.1 hypothetical protein [Amycolatopsis pithecellobii]
MRDAEVPQRLVPSWGRVLLVAGFAFAGWLLAGLLGSAVASAEEPPQADRPAAGQAGGLLGGLLTTVTTTVQELTATVHTTVSTVTSTVTTTVTETTKTVVAPVTSAPARTTAPAPEKHKTTTQSRVDPVVTEKPVLRQVPRPAPVRAVTVASQPPVGHKQQPARPAAVPPVRQAPVSENPVQAMTDPPAPTPSTPGGQFGSAVAAHDTGNNSKHPLAILGARGGVAQSAPIGVPRRHAQAGNSREAALPTTSPD